MGDKSALLPPGGKADLNLDIRDGDTLLVIKRSKDGEITFPAFVGNPGKEDGMKTAIVALLGDALDTLDPEPLDLDPS